MRKQCLAAFGSLLFGLFLSAAAQGAPFNWPQGARAAVSLGYDDGLASQLDHVVPALNARGLRDDKDVAKATANDIAVVGDSFAWGWGVQAEERFSDRLQKLTGKRVFNVSTPTDLAGYGALIAYARKLGGKFGTVVLAICMENDLLDYGAGAGDADRVLVANPGGVRGWLERTSAAYLLLTTAVQQTAWLKAPAVWLGVITPNLEGIAQSDFSEAAIDSSARKVADLARNQRLLVVIIPSRALWIGDNRAVEDRIHKGFLAALGRLGIDFVDLRPLLEAGGQPLSYHFANDGHWNARGHELAAELTLAYLAGRGLARRLRTRPMPAP